MKKLRLKALALGAREILSREQLRGITGGCTSDDMCSHGYCNQYGYCADDTIASGSAPEYASGDVPCIPGYNICGNCGCMTAGDCAANGSCGA